ncbi:conserved hypothetical protein [Leishmania major strain Friedlin]|uniref:LicD/FKTN/FKRP nucleotidyltransferase domain-containing protein n=1 Tax=Leishmania major TaxID=5664 RepID=Q4Q5E7_LEIMA|nr:conserved hypothetical protein [Leishmania major strain Friedlin]CAG9580201.1 LicD_family_-_putative [Leishmania major strain Friedlin]CAJ08655.1 conserved hypothetical protein [Leishmania major strain Friedlin]|eukprot:XP_001685451.1 conserved hypothetical protein [Leishmania major strain Friedlin]
MTSSCTIVPGHRVASSASGSQTPQASTRQDASWLHGNAPSSVFELRRDALLEWLHRFSERERNVGVSGVETPLSEEKPEELDSSVDLDTAYRAFLRCEDATAQEALFTRLVDWVDAQCAQPVVSSGASPTSAFAAPATSAAAAAEDRQWGGIRIPQCLAVPCMAAAMTSKERKATAAHVGEKADGVRAANAFEANVRRRFPDNAAVVTKQLAFQEALLAVQEVLTAQKIRFFLACGTALGARRDGCFIPYDEDIDLGILYADIAVPVTEGDDWPVPDLSFPSTAPAGLSYVQMRVYRLLHALASTRAFVVFDICGAVEKGLELRALHLATSARIDINLYYPPLCTTACGGDGDASDDALVRETGPFVWAASFYEAAGARKHRMYRYRHKPFATELEELPFCAKTASVGRGFLVPPERYLVENYGEDWRTPKQYSYTEGLAGEFKNILKE